ncbi:MAG: alanine--tRNA ligase [Lactobacillales bacterium]|jgi:alanyl-tRNA synthetase|nr:alanine--tRNA ligase [Lactobacillales bacterium]
MKQLTSAQVRQLFLDFFKSKGHTVEPSASLIPVNDPTLLWINSGVATLKKYFDGSEVPENPRITNAQKSIRTNDIENVGKTARHHTMFEMLGNFSIGDYFKKEVIPWAWEFLTSPEWIGFDPEKLYVTVYPKDTEAHRIWHEVVGLPEDHIIPIEDNFWDIGAGPSGPDSEIFYDRGPEYLDIPEDDPENYPGGENERYLEVWNLVFSEFNHIPDTDNFEPLPHKNIDTGMGLERMVSIIQDAPTNFETDLFLPIIHEVEVISGQTYNPKHSASNMSFKVIADHVRALSFAIGDGALPGNEGRGYVLRRLLRRAVMHGKKLGIEEAFLYKLVPIVGEIMESYYPEVLENAEFIQKVIRQEEETFHKTIDAGSSKLDSLLADLKKSGKDTLDGRDIFTLYDTYGFPVELTEELAEDEGLKVDHAGFEVAMKEQQERARSARSKDLSMGVQSAVLTDIKAESTFDYEHHKLQSELLTIVSDEARVDTLTTGTAQLIFAHTPFYAEMGGQVADHGVIKSLDGTVVAEVTDVQKAPNGQPLHTVNVRGSLVQGETYELEIDEVRRAKVIKNHTATHLLHAALKNTLGAHANQAGSLNETTFLRFDFTHFGQVTAEELQQIENEVNEVIWQALPVEVIETDIDTAKKMGAMALFGEKYGHDVRVVKIGEYSLELCGGTHTKDTSEIGIFKIVSESGIGSGTRRIVAVTSQEAYELYREEEEQLKAVSAMVKSPQLKDVPTKVEALQEQLRELQKENETLATKLANQQAGDIFKDVQEAGGVSFIASQVHVKDMNQLRGLADQWKQKGASDVLVLANTVDGKVNLLVAMMKTANEKGLKAGDLIKAIAPLVSGGGGGRPDMAQAGGKNPAGIPAALNEVKNWLNEK